MGSKDGSLSPDRLRSRIAYDEETGSLTWLPLTGIGREVKRWNSRYSGKEAGRVSNEWGYICLHFDKRMYVGHRLIWLYMTGAWPDGEIDHINCNPADNRWCNLRLATRSQNQANIGAHKSNVLGLKGVTWEKSRHRWRAHIGVNYKKINLGRFDCPAAAHFAYAIAAEKYFGEFARSA